MGRFGLSRALRCTFVPTEMINLVFGGLLLCFALLEMFSNDNTPASSKEVRFFGYVIVSYLVLGDI